MSRPQLPACHVSSRYPSRSSPSARWLLLMLSRRLCLWHYSTTCSYPTGHTDTSFLDMLLPWKEAFPFLYFDFLLLSFPPSINQLTSNSFASIPLLAQPSYHPFSSTSWSLYFQPLLWYPLGYHHLLRTRLSSCLQAANFDNCLQSMSIRSHCALSQTHQTHCCTQIIPPIYPLYL